MRVGVGMTPIPRRFLEGGPSSARRIERSTCGGVSDPVGNKGAMSDHEAKSEKGKRTYLSCGETRV